MDQLLYRFKIILRMKGFMLRCVICPIIVATLCYTSFERVQYATISEGDRIAIGIVGDDHTLKEIFDQERFEVYNITETVAEKYLEDGVISSYIRLTSPPELITVKYEDEQKITKAYLDAYLTGTAPARIREQHMIGMLEGAERSAGIPNFAKLSMAITGTCISGLLLMTLLGKKRREIAVRSSIAAKSGLSMIAQDLIIVTVLLTFIFLILYGYIYFILKV